MFDLEKALHKAWHLGYCDMLSQDVLREALTQSTYDEVQKSASGIIPADALREIYNAGHL